MDIKVKVKEIEKISVKDTREVVTVEKPVYPEVKDLEITPSKETQVFKEDGMNYGEVKVLGDEDLLSSNIKQGVEIFGVVGAMKEMPEEVQEGIEEQKEIISTQEEILENINQVINDKILVKEKYKPRYLVSKTFSSYTGSELDYEISMLDVTYLTDFSYMFYSCTNLTRLNLSGWDTSNATDMSYMFNRCGYNTNNFTLDLGDNFNTSNVTSTSFMFKDCPGLISLNLGDNFDTSKVTNMNQMFSGCVGLTSLNFGDKFNTSNIPVMRGMFNNCANLTSLNLSIFNTSNVTSMMEMFNNCVRLTHLDIRNFTFNKVTNYTNMFTGVPADCLIIVKGDTEKQWITSKFTTLTNVKTVAELEG